MHSIVHTNRNRQTNTRRDRQTNRATDRQTDRQAAPACFLKTFRRPLGAPTRPLRAYIYRFACSPCADTHFEGHGVQLCCRTCANAVCKAKIALSHRCTGEENSARGVVDNSVTISNRGRSTTSRAFRGVSLPPPTTATTTGLGPRALQSGLPWVPGPLFCLPAVSSASVPGSTLLRAEPPESSPFCPPVPAVQRLMADPRTRRQPCPRTPPRPATAAAIYCSTLLSDGSPGGGWGAQAVYNFKASL